MDVWFGLHPGQRTGPYGEFDTLPEFIDQEDIDNRILWAHGLRGLEEELSNDFPDRLIVDQPAL